MAAAVQSVRKPFVGELLGREDFAIISDIVEPNSKVLDLGCGEGELLEWLAENKGVEARGVEISATKAQRAIARGVSAYQGDIDEVLEDYSDHAFDYVILSQTLQETRNPLRVLREMLRVGRPYEWYNSPNIHFLTVHDFDQLARGEGFTVERCYFIAGRHKVAVLPNLLAEVAVYLVSK